MEQKENDMLLNVLENPSFNIQDFQEVGLNTNNTSLQTQDTYANSPQIQNNPLLTDNKGQLDTDKLTKYYNAAAQVYNTMAQDPKQDVNDVKVQYSKYDIWAPADKVDWNQQFQINTHEVNPDATSWGAVRVGEQGPRTKTAAELAESRKVYNPTTKQWEASPEDSFVDNLLHVRALAQYDKDVDENGIERGQAGFDENKIAHTAGELKINPDTGTYYYEDIDGKNIHGKQILHISDVLTREDSPLNSIDFFDSDDIHKTPIGSFVKNAALVGSMFIPYVGPWITGATIVQQAASFGATLGKIAAGSDNEVCNFVQGLSESTNMINSKSEYSNQNMWTWENLFNMVGNTVAQLKQQRMLFEGLPKLVGMDGRVTSEAGRQAWTEDRIQQLAKGNASKLESKYGMSMEELANVNKIQLKSDLDQLYQVNSLKAAADLENYSKQYYNTGAILSKAYMTMLTVNDMYDNAKAAGASDTAAMLTTLGYAVAEYGLLSTGLGEWILPELRQNRMMMKASINTLKKDLQSGAFQAMEASAKTPADKIKFASKLINYGKKLLTADWNVGRQGTFAKTAVSTLAGGFGEGTEEVSEDVLQDFVSRCYNFAQELSGNSDNKIHNENWGQQYIMDFLGGFLGGGISNSAISFNVAKESGNMTSEKAIQNIVSMARDPEQKIKLIKMIDKTELGNKNLSATQYVKDKDGNIIGFASGTKEDNQDLASKNLVKSYIDLVSSTLDVAGANIDNDSLFDEATLKDLRFKNLYNSTMTGYLFQKFNDLGTQYIKVTNQIASLRKELNIPDQEYKQDDPEVKKKTAKLTQYSKQLDDIAEQIQNIREGKNTEMYMLPALLETSPSISMGFNNAATFAQYVKATTGNTINELSDTELTEVSNKYKEYIRSTGKDDIINMSQNYKQGALLMASKFAEIQNWFNKNGQEHIGNQSELNAGLEAVATGENSETPDTAKWLEEAQNLANAKRENKNQYGNIEFNETNGEVIKNKQNPEVDQIFQGINDVITNNIDASDDVIKSKIVEAILKPLQNIDSFIQTTKYATPWQKSVLIERLNALKNLFHGVNDDIGQIIQDSLGDDSEVLDFYSTIKGDENLGDTNAVGDLNQGGFNSIDKAIDERIAAVENMQYTPIQELANKYALITGQSSISFIDLMNQLQKLEEATSSDVSKFTLNEKTIQYINQAKRVLHQLKSLVEGARDDDAALTEFDGNTMTPKNNIWGINKTLNDIAEKSKDDKWKPLPTIGGDLADALKIDIFNLDAKLNYYLNLYGVNKGQKLNSQTTITANLVYKYYYKYKRFCEIVTTDIPDDWDKTALQNATTTFIESKINDENRLQLTSEELTQLKKEQLSIEDSIYNFFKANQDKDFSKLFEHFDIINNKPCLANDTTEELDDLSFIGYLIANASVNSKSINQLLLNCPSITENKFIPSEPQIQAIKLAVGNIVNGDFTTKLIQYLKAAQKNKFYSTMSFNDRVTHLNTKLGYGKVTSNILATESYGRNVFDKFDYGLFYNNITLCEALPGGGKTSAVDSLVCQIINQISNTDTEHSEYLKGAWVSNTTEKTTKKFNEDNLKIDDAKLFTKEQLLTKISDWKKPDYKNGSIIDYRGRINLNTFETEFKLKSSITDIPKVIFIDEIGMWTTDELQLLDNFAQKYGISVLATGDYFQSQTQYQVTLGSLNKTTKDNIRSEITDSEVQESLKEGVTPGFDGITINISTNSNNLLHTPKIGFSFRTANTQQDVNQAHVLTQMQSIQNNPSTKVDINLHYYESKDSDNYVLHGTKVVTPIQVEEITDILDKLIPQLQDGEKIGYIYTDTDSAIYKALMNNPKYRDHIQEYYGTAQGLEGRYWISELDKKDSFSFLQDLYTDITRAKVGSILVTPKDWDRSAVANNISSIKNIKDSETSSFDITKEIKPYNEKYKKILNAAIDEVQEVKIISRKDNSSSTTSPTPATSTSPTPAPVTPPHPTVSTSQDEFNKWYTDERESERNTVMGVAIDIKSQNDVLQKVVDDSNAIIDKLLGYLNDDSLTINNDQRKAMADEITDLEKVRFNALKYQRILESTMDQSEIDDSDIQLAPGAITLNFNKKLNHPEIFNLWFKNTDVDYSDYILKNIEWNNTNPDKVTITYQSNGIDGFTTIDINDLDSNTKSYLLYYTQSDPDGDFDPELYKHVETSEINISPIEDTDLGRNLLFFSGTSFNLGAHIDQNGNIILSGIPGRIDGLNAFFEYDNNGNIVVKKEFSFIKSPQQAINILLKLRGYALNSYDKSSLISHIQDILGLKNVNIKFALKSGNIVDQSDLGRLENQYKNGWGRYDQLRGESVLHQNLVGEQTNSKGKTHREFVMIISSGNTVIEVPLFKPNNPVTKAISLNLIAKDNLPKDFRKAISKVADEASKKIKGLEQAINKATSQEDKEKLSKNLQVYSNLFNWAKYYYSTSGQRTIIYLNNDFIPSKDLINQGPIFETDRGLSTAIDDKLEYPAKEITLDDLKAKNPELNISKILVSKRNIVKDGKILLPSGHIFVLISTDPSISSTSKMIDQFNAQIADSTVPKKVILKLVTSPQVSIREYLESLFKKNGSPSLGGIITSYKILKQLFTDPSIKGTLTDLLKDTQITNSLESQKLAQSEYDQLSKLFNDLAELQKTNPKELYRILNTEVTWNSEQTGNNYNLQIHNGSKNPHKLWEQCIFTLKRLSQTNAVSFDDEGGITEGFNIDDEKVDKICKLASNVKIYYSSKLERSSDNDFIPIAVKQNTYQIPDNVIMANRNYTIFGNVASNTFRTTDKFQEEILGAFDKKLEDVTSNIVRSTDNEEYNKLGNSINNPSKPKWDNSTSLFLKNINNNYGIKVNQYIPQKVDGKLSSKDQETIFNDLLNKGIIWFTSSFTVKQLSQEEINVINNSPDSKNTSLYEFMNSSNNLITYQFGDESVTIDKNTGEISYKKDSLNTDEQNKQIIKDALSDEENPLTKILIAYFNTSYEELKNQFLSSDKAFDDNLFQIKDALKDIDKESLTQYLDEETIDKGLKYSNNITWC